MAQHSDSATYIFIHFSYIYFRLHYILGYYKILNGEGNGTPLQYSCLENPMDGGAWWAAVHGVAKSWTWLNDFPFTFHFHALEKEMATHSSVLAWRIPGTGEPGGLPSMRSHRVGHDWSDLAAAAATTEELVYRGRGSSGQGNPQASHTPLSYSAVCLPAWECLKREMF